MIRRCLQQNVEPPEHIEAAEDGALDGHLLETPPNGRLWLEAEFLISNWLANKRSLKW